MGQHRTHVFVCTSGDTCPTQGDVERLRYRPGIQGADKKKGAP